MFGKKGRVGNRPWGNTYKRKKKGYIFVVVVCVCVCVLCCLSCVRSTCVCNFIYFVSSLLVHQRKMIKCTLFARVFKITRL